MAVLKRKAVQNDRRLLTVLRYVERNPVRATLATRVEDWRWGGAWSRAQDGAQRKGLPGIWPVRRPSNWLEFVSAPRTEGELAALRHRV